MYLHICSRIYIPMRLHDTITVRDYTKTTGEPTEYIYMYKRLHSLYCEVYRLMLV